MRIIAHSPANNTSYVINSETYNVEGTGSHEACEAYIKYMKFHDFWFSTKDSHGRTLTHNPTRHYHQVFRADHYQTEYDRPASGWWSYTHPVGRKFSIPHTHLAQIDAPVHPSL